MYDKKNNIPHEVPFYWKMQHFKLLGGSEHPPCISGWRHPELCWSGVVYLLEVVGCDWSVWILYKPHLASAGAEKRRPAVVFKSGLFTDNLLEVIIIKKILQQMQPSCKGSEQMFQVDESSVRTFWVKKQWMQFYLDIWMYTLSVRVCTCCRSVDVLPLYESHGHAGAHTHT